MNKATDASTTKKNASHLTLNDQWYTKQSAQGARTGSSGLTRKQELMKSMREIERNNNNAKLNILKRSKAIRKPQSAKQPRISKASVQPIQFHCDACNEDFLTGQALGGHMSRVHPGQSNSYQRKI